MKWFACNKSKDDCGLNSMYIIASYKKIDLTFLETQNIDCNQKPRGNKGKVIESSSIEENSGIGISIYKYEFELTP